MRGPLVPGPRTEQSRLARKPWRAWYQSARWKRLRLATFTRDLFTCRMCKKIEGNMSKLICDHIVPHRGDPGLFWSESNLQTMCKPCHDGAKQRAEQAR